eukprot:TRINITY_DN19108_c0_g1_i1.p1 TRINITY_DN19108_c0_g1~~TRINITY_DN19108_c0_g1_i1.p1  ORF type:complete len:483 (+),score=85.10 TRINITY_DN19108_c0_g1_i1:42-1451(+)
MGCGVSAEKTDEKGKATAPPGRGRGAKNEAGTGGDNWREKQLDEESYYSSDEEPARPGLDRNRTKSEHRLDILAKERNEEEPAIFLWGDFVVDVNQIEKKPHVKKNPRQPPRIRHAKASLQDSMFHFGDFAVSMINDEEDAFNELKIPNDDQRPKKNLEEYHIRSYSKYSLIGHSARVKCICVSPSESFFISCSNEDASMTMCNIETGKEIMSFMGHDDTIISACFSNDAKYLATTSRDNTMILWDVTTGKQTLTFEHEKVVICCCFSRDSKLLVSGCQDKVCRIWETKKGREQNSFMEHDGIIISVSFSPDGSHIVSASADKTLRIWKTSDVSAQHTLRGHTGIVLSCAYRSDGKFIVSNDERILKVWDAVRGTCSLSLSVDEVPRPNTQPGKKQTWTLSNYCPGRLGYYIIAACNSRTVHVFHPKDGNEVLALYCKAPVYCLSCGSHSKVAFGDSFGNVFIVTLAAG